MSTGRWATNPWIRLQSVARESDRTMEHRALSLHELELLSGAAMARPANEWRRSHPKCSEDELAELSRVGEDRARLYRFAAFTGLRRNECAQIRRRDLVLDGAEPHVIVRATNSKNRTEQRVPLLLPIAEELRSWLDRRRVGPDERAFAVKGQSWRCCGRTRSTPASGSSTSTAAV